GTADQPRLTGAIQVARGSHLYFEGNDFEVRRGTIQYADSDWNNPILDATLFTIVEDRSNDQIYRITVPLLGNLDQLSEIQPESDPMLDRSSIFALLLTGVPYVAGPESEQFAGQMKAFVSGHLLLGYQQKLASALGLSRIEIQTRMKSGTEQETTSGPAA